MQVALIELDSLYVGEEVGSPSLEAHAPLPAQLPRLNEGAACSLGHLLPACSSSWLPFNWISSSRSQACHLSQALLTITSAPTLSSRFRAELITRLPLRQITGRLPAATYHQAPPGGALLCLYLWGDWFCPPSFVGSRVKRQSSRWLAQSGRAMLRLGTYGQSWGNWVSTPNSASCRRECRPVWMC